MVNKDTIMEPRLRCLTLGIHSESFVIRPVLADQQ